MLTENLIELALPLRLLSRVYLKTIKTILAMVWCRGLKLITETELLTKLLPTVSKLLDKIVLFST